MILDFDIEYAQLALKTRLGKVVTRNGFIVSIISWTCPLDKRPIVGFIAGNSTYHSWNENGKWYSNGLEHSKDLFVEVKDDIWTV